MEIDTTTSADTGTSSEENSTTASEVASILNLPNYANTGESDSSQETNDTTTVDDESTSSSAATDEETQDSGTNETQSVVSQEETSQQQTQHEENSTTDVPSFSLEITDANGKAFVINPGDNLEQVLADFEPTNNGQIFQMLADLNRLAGEKAAFETEQAKAEEDNNRQSQVDQLLATWDKEQATLVANKRLPIGADGKPKEERLSEVFAYMNDENQKRMQEGRPIISSFEDALDKLELKETKAKQAQEARDKKELARKNGALVGGSSAPETASTPVYRGGARNAADAARMMGLL